MAAAVCFFAGCEREDNSGYGGASVPMGDADPNAASRTNSATEPVYGSGSRDDAGRTAAEGEASGVGASSAPAVGEPGSPGSSQPAPNNPGNAKSGSEPEQ